MAIGARETRGSGPGEATGAVVGALAPAASFAGATGNAAFAALVTGAGAGPAVLARQVATGQAAATQPAPAPAPAAAPATQAGRDGIISSSIQATVDAYRTIQITVPGAGTTITVRTPYHMRPGDEAAWMRQPERVGATPAEHAWYAALPSPVRHGISNPSDVRRALQQAVNRGLVNRPTEATVQAFANRWQIGVDCAGFVRRALADSHAALRESGQQGLPSGRAPLRGSGVDALAHAGTRVTMSDDLRPGDVVRMNRSARMVGHIRIIGTVTRRTLTSPDQAPPRQPQTLEWIVYTAMESGGSGPTTGTWWIPAGQDVSRDDVATANTWSERDGRFRPADRERVLSYWHRFRDAAGAAATPAAPQTPPPASASTPGTPTRRRVSRSLDLEPAGDREQGLRGAASVPRDGMRFDFDGPQRAPFTMRGVAMPLDLVTLDGAGRVQETRPMAPGEDRVQPERPYTSAIEMESGRAAREGLRSGVVARFARQIDAGVASPARPPMDAGAPARPAAGSPGSTLAGQTTETYYNIREQPGTGRVLGALQGQPVDVGVDDKQRIGTETWYRITLRGPVGPLPAGTVGWVTSAAVAPEIGWTAFRGQLRAWEQANARLGVSDRITRLRQMSHASNLPFDAVIGTPEGSTYADQRPFNRGEWSLLQDTQAVRMPDGRLVDVYHLLVGLDVLPRMDESRNIETHLMTVNVGQNYSAATWSGDIGAAVADAYLRQDSEWERNNPRADVDARRRHYFRSRAPEADLLGDIDAWRVDDLRGSGATAATSVEELLARYYEPAAAPAAGPGGAQGTTNPRREAVIRFLRHYGFNTQQLPLRSQPARADMGRQIAIFADLWRQRRQGILGLGHRVGASWETDYVWPMTDMFLDWLEQLAASTGAQLSTSGVRGAVDVDIQ